jgi:tetratricopeptide (TPR) repeat protein
MKSDAMMKYALVALVIGLSFLAAGCGSNPAFSLRPLYLESEKHAAEPRLEGEWTPVTLGSSGVSREISERWTLTAQNDGCYQAERRKKDAEKDQEEHEIYRVCLVALDGRVFFDQKLEEKNVGRQMVRVEDMAPDLAAMHMIGRVWAQQDFLRFTRLRRDWIKEKQPDELRTTIGQALVFTGTTPQLRDIMTQHGEDPGVMSSALYLCRPATDCSLQVVEDELARGPKNTDVLRGAAQFYAGREDYDRAIALLSKRAELTAPEDAASARQEVGMARLLKRDFPGARADFAGPAKQDTQDQLNNDLLTGISYFMEGKYADAHRTFAKLPDSAFAVFIILDYASQARMGRGRQAESFFSDRMARFVGEEEEHLLLLRAAGRVRDFSADKFTQDELDRGDGALYALVRLTQGDRQAARQALELTVNKVGKGSPVFVGAKIELERLNASEPKPKQ